MTSAAEQHLVRRDRYMVALLAVLAVLAATPGVHLVELWLPPRPALLLSHGVALVLLALAGHRWRVGRARRSGP